MLFWIIQSTVSNDLILCVTPLTQDYSVYNFQNVTSQPPPVITRAVSVITCSHYRFWVFINANIPSTPVLSKSLLCSLFVWQTLSLTVYYRAYQCNTERKVLQLDRIWDVCDEATSRSACVACVLGTVIFKSLEYALIFNERDIFVEQVIIVLVLVWHIHINTKTYSTGGSNAWTSVNGCQIGQWYYANG